MAYEEEFYDTRFFLFCSFVELARYCLFCKTLSTITVLRLETLGKEY